MASACTAIGDPWMPRPASALIRTTPGNVRATIPTARLTSIREQLALRLGAQPMRRRPTHRCPLRLTSPVAPLVALDRGTHRPVPARQRALERFLPRLDPSKVPDGVHNPPLGLAKPAELADGLALARYAALRRRFAPATTWIASVPPLAGHGWHGDSARYVPRHAITPLTGIAATAPTAPNP